MAVLFDIMDKIIIFAESVCYEGQKMNIKRETYLKKIRTFYDKALIKILTGQRRVGKSYLLLQIMEEIRHRKPKANIIFIDKEKFEFSAIKDGVKLMLYVKDHVKEKTANYLFIDEVQEIDSFEKTLRSLLNEGIADIYCTGSNAQLFSSELATLLSGRQVAVKIHPLSFPEFLKFHDLINNDHALNYFLEFGGLPFLINLPKEKQVVFEYLKNIVSTIIFKDVVNRNNIRDVGFLDNLIAFIADITGSVFSARKIKAFLKSQYIDKSISSIINYTKYLEEANIISKVSRKDIQGKKILEVGGKYYFEDLGIRNALVGYRVQDINKIMENTVYNHLIYCGYSVYIGKLAEKEIDFIAEKENEIIYVQVAYLLKDEPTIQREFGNLNAIHDHYPKYVVSMDSFPINTTYKGIRHLHLRDFLNHCF